VKASRVCRLARREKRHTLAKFGEACSRYAAATPRFPEPPPPRLTSEPRRPIGAAAWRREGYGRPNALFFDLRGEGDTAFDIAAYYDGRTLTLSEQPGGDWAQTTVPGTLDGMLDDVMRRFGLPVPIGDVVCSSPYDAFIGSSTRGGLVARKTLGDVPCVKLDYADDLVEVRLWLPASGPTLPRRIELVYKRALPPLVSQLDFTSWKLDVPVGPKS
jgi:hypothetical protein